jgi:putative ABC transport system permease protein
LYILAVYSIVSRLLVEMAVLGLILSAVGIYGVIANLAAERTPEIGIRMALGAQSRDVLWLILRNGIFLASIGTAIGLALSFGVVYALSKTMPDIPGKSPLVVAGVAAMLVAVSLIASWLPARKATRVDPLAALRTE